MFVCLILVAMNYQTEGRMLELNRAKFSSNGNCGYILKPKCMCKGTSMLQFVKSERQLSLCEDVITFLVFSQLPLTPCWRILCQDTERLS